ncbi:DNA replication/repair protein RecF [Agromyces atrinae]|uniref:DNA replication/repair protein RecF n=1 Tax=Agromyces atrinae TaxID=592376 RepID=UPI001F571DBF|nr:DNA replication/repair protein RecF [Agromyces atrinae]MCI2956827.1 DNA replication/repair protein RecF [Agromyces atrinae]
MHVTHLSLTDYRNYATAEIDLSAGATLLVGRNGQGKTNLVEAIGYLSTLGSHRVSSDQALIRAGAEAAIIRARLQHAGRELLVEVQLNRGAANRAQVNRSPIKTRELPRYCHSVLFAPEDLALVRSEPGVRRRFLDELLVQQTPRLAGVMSDYDRVLRQRNTLLKSARSSGLREAQLSTLEIWDERLVTFGSEIIDERSALVAELAEPLRVAYRGIVDADHGPALVPLLSIDGRESADVPVVSEIPAIPTADRFRAALANQRRAELDRGVTLAGPHRDDVLLELNGLPAKGYASHGESWSFALALKLASAELLRRDSAGGDPVLILDDVFAELDRRRRESLAAAITGYEQVLITAAVLEDVPDALAERVVHIHRGEIVDGPRDE